MAEKLDRVWVWPAQNPQLPRGVCGPFGKNLTLIPTGVHDYGDTTLKNCWGKMAAGLVKVSDLRLCRAKPEGFRLD